jgi:hypothetical protein
MGKLSSLKYKKTNRRPCNKPHSKRIKEIISIPLQIFQNQDLSVHDLCLVIHATQPFFHGGGNVYLCEECKGKTCSIIHDNQVHHTNGIVCLLASKCNMILFYSEFMYYHLPTDFLCFFPLILTKLLPADISYRTLLFCK